MPYNDHAPTMTPPFQYNLHFGGVSYRKCADVGALLLLDDRECGHSPLWSPARTVRRGTPKHCGWSLLGPCLPKTSIHESWFNFCLGQLSPNDRPLPWWKGPGEKSWNFGGGKNISWTVKRFGHHVLSWMPIVGGRLSDIGLFSSKRRLSSSLELNSFCSTLGGERGLLSLLFERKNAVKIFKPSE